MLERVYHQQFLPMSQFITVTHTHTDHLSMGMPLSLPLIKPSFPLATAAAAEKSNRLTGE